MDLLQSAIRTLFYDVNIERIFQDIKNDCCTFLKCDFASLSAWTTQTFTRSELALLQSYVVQNTIGVMPKWHHSMQLLDPFINICLDKNNVNLPIVKFDKLQYWRSLSLLLGEDLLTTFFLASKTSKNNPITSYDWPNIIGHNEEKINNVLTESLCDVHAHLKASADIFELTWLDFMNFVINRDESYRSVQNLADVNLQSKRDEKTCSFRKMIQIAAILRMHIYEILYKKKLAKNNNFIKNIIYDDKLRTSYLTELQSKISLYRNSNYQKYDYASTKSLSSNIYSIHQGERKLLYEYFLNYLQDIPKIVKIADWMFLYISLKIRIRKEFVQTNPLYGFENFKIYESRKSRYCGRYEELYPLYAVQSSIREKTRDYFEARVTPGGIPNIRLECSLDHKSKRSDININSLTFIVHFIKQNEKKIHKKNFGMRFDFKQDYVTQLFKVLDDAEKRRTARSPFNYVEKRRIGYSLFVPPYKIVGIDAAGEEIECPPAVFGHIYRYARAAGLKNLTYHVGEDFYDIADGLKNIDDSIRFLGLNNGSRLGHAIAIGAKPSSYYENRGYQIIMSKQRMLDVLVWVLATCRIAQIRMSSDFEKQLTDKSKELYKEIGYSIPYDEKKYYQSMLLRSDDIIPKVEKSLWDKTSLCLDDQCVEARKEQDVEKLCTIYLSNKDIWNEGNVVDMFIYHKDISSIVEQIQNYMMAIIVKKKIAIESNPSSNVKIGPIDGYNSHPCFCFLSNGINVSVNTDDKGIFATSLPNEYSLIANAYCQNGHTVTEAALLIGRLKTNAHKQRFKVENIHIGLKNDKLMNTKPRQKFICSQILLLIFNKLCLCFRSLKWGFRSLIRTINLKF